MHNLHDLRITPRLLVVGGVIAALAVLGSAVVIRGLRTPFAVPAQSSSGQANGSSSGYAEASSCAACHAEIARTYALTGMGRSFVKVQSGSKGVADFSN